MKICPKCHRKHRFFQRLFRRKCDLIPIPDCYAGTPLESFGRVSVQEDDGTTVGTLNAFQAIVESVSLIEPGESPALEPSDTSESVLLESPELSSPTDSPPSYESPSSDSSTSFDSPTSDSSGIC